MLHSQYIDRESEALRGSDFWVFCLFSATVSKVSTLLFNLFFYPDSLPKGLGHILAPKGSTVQRDEYSAGDISSTPLLAVHRKVEILAIISVFGSMCQTLSTVVYDDWVQGRFCTWWGFGVFFCSEVIYWSKEVIQEILIRLLCCLRYWQQNRNSFKDAAHHSSYVFCSSQQHLHSLLLFRITLRVTCTIFSIKAPVSQLQFRSVVMDCNLKFYYQEIFWL